MAAVNLTMAQAAEAAGVGYEHFRKIWPSLCAREGFPAPVHGRKWDAEAVAAWRKARSERDVTPLPRKRVEAPAADAGRRARAALAALREAC